MARDLSANITTEIATEEHRPIELYIVTLDDYISYTYNAIFVREWGGLGAGDGELNTPSGIFIDNDEVYVADQDNNRIQVFNLSGTFQRKWGSSGSGDGEFNDPCDVFVCNNEVYVVDRGNDRIQVFNTAGAFQRKWGINGSGDGEFDHPQRIFVDSEVYVADQNNHRVQVFDLTGTFQRKWGINGSGDGEFEFSSGICVYNSEVYVGDNNPRIQVFDVNGVFQKQIDISGAFAAGTSRAMDIKIKNNKIYFIKSYSTSIATYNLEGVFQYHVHSMTGANLMLGFCEHEERFYSATWNAADGECYVQVFRGTYVPTYHFQTLYFTDHDQNIDFFDLDGNPQTFTAAAISRSEVKTNIDNHIDSVTVHLDNVNRAMTDYIVTYKFRGRRMIVWRVYEDYLTESDDYITIFDGLMDKPAIAEGSMEIVVKSRLGTLVKQVPRRMYQVHCNWEFGSTECTIDRLTTQLTEVLVTAGVTSNIIVIAGAAHESIATDYYKFGTVRFQSGDNNKETRSITYSKGSLANYGVQGVELGLSYSLDYDPAGDTATVQQGCDKTPTTCENKYANLVNYGGFITVPQGMVRR